MPSGFIGMPAEKYIADVLKGLDNAINAHNADPFQNLANREPPPPEVLPRNNVVIISELTGNSDGYSTGIGSSANIVTDCGDYENVIKLITDADNNIADCLHTAAAEIEELCGTSFVLPAASPKCKAIAGGVKESLEGFVALTVATIIDTKKFAADITSIG